MLTPAHPPDSTNELIDVAAAAADLAAIAQTHRGRESEMRAAVAQRLKAALIEGRRIAEELLLKDRHGRRCAERLCLLQDEIIRLLFEFARELGARPSTMDADEHDRLMAFVSHLPQLAASALMEVIGSAAGGGALRLAGRGLVDTTRLASSPPDTWRDVCATNADAVADALDVLIARLSELRGDLRHGEAVNRIFTDAAKWRAELMSGRD